MTTPLILTRSAFHTLLVRTLNKSTPQEKAEIKAELLRWVERREQQEAK
jgi:hypothetical protein